MMHKLYIEIIGQGTVALPTTLQRFFLPVYREVETHNPGNGLVLTTLVKPTKMQTIQEIGPL